MEQKGARLLVQVDKLGQILENWIYVVIKYWRRWQRTPAGEDGKGRIRVEFARPGAAVVLFR